MVVVPSLEVIKNRHVLYYHLAHLQHILSVVKLSLFYPLLSDMFQESINFNLLNSKHMRMRYT
jgi:hypothetical protein